MSNRLSGTEYQSLGWLLLSWSIRVSSTKPWEGKATKGSRGLGIRLNIQLQLKSAPA